MTGLVERLAAVVAARQGADPGTSYTAKILAAGPERAARKLGEEAIETIVEAVAGRPGGVVKESADLLYHLAVLWAAMGIDAAAIGAELARREGLSGLEEKSRRPTDGV